MTDSNNQAFDLNLFDSPWAAAIGPSSKQDPFTSTNPLFTTAFKDIHSLENLSQYIINKSPNKTVIHHNDIHWELFEIKLNSSAFLYLLKNISNELQILKQLKKQLTDLTHSNKLHTEILEKELPISILVVDKDFNVSYANHTLKRLFHIPSMVNLQKCYNYFKKLKPCGDCIIESIKEGQKRKKKTFCADHNRMITAEVHPLDDKYIITFRDTTKEIGLINEIKKQHEELQSANRRIAEQNDILKHLSNINIRISQMRNLETILEAITHSIIETFSCKKGAIILFNETGKIKNANFSSDISTEERNLIIRSIEIDSSVNTKDAPAIITSENDIRNLIRNELKNYITQDMHDKEKLVGKIFLYTPEKTIDQSILELFLMQVIVYLESIELQRKLEEVAQTDSLTGVFNRYYFDKQFIEEKNLSMKFGQPLSLILIDLNGLKEINDRIGHEAGDILLKEAARLLTHTIQTYGSVFRIGGDEFVILIPNCPETRLNTIMDTLIHVQKTATFEHNNQPYLIRFSIGGTCSTNTEHDRLKDEADKRMYTDKLNFYKTHAKYR